MKKKLFLIIVIVGISFQVMAQSSASAVADRIGLIGFWRMTQMYGRSGGEDFSQELDGSRFYIFKDNGACQYSTGDRKIADAKWTLKGKEFRIWGNDTVNDPDGIDYTFEIVTVTPEKLVLKLSGGESYVYSTFRKANASLKQVGKPYTPQKSDTDVSTSDSDIAKSRTEEKRTSADTVISSQEPTPIKPSISTTINKSDVYFSGVEARGNDVEIVCWLNPRINGTRMEAISAKYEKGGKFTSKDIRVDGNGGQVLPRNGNPLNRGNRVNHSERFYVTATIKNAAHLHSLDAVYIRVWTSYGEGEVIVKNIQW